MYLECGRHNNEWHQGNASPSNPYKQKVTFTCMNEFQTKGQIIFIVRSITSVTEWRPRPVQDTYVSCPPLLPRPIIPDILFTKPFYLTLPQIWSPFSIPCNLESGEDLSVSRGLSCDGGTFHLQLSVLPSQFASIWVLLQIWESRVGSLLSSGDDVMSPSWCIVAIEEIMNTPDDVLDTLLFPCWKQNCTKQHKNTKSP